jgi:hypothetical protein
MIVGSIPQASRPIGRAATASTARKGSRSAAVVGWNLFGLRRLQPVVLLSFIDPASEIVLRQEGHLDCVLLRKFLE